MEVERASFSLWPRRRPRSAVLDARDSSSNRRTRTRFSPSTSAPPPPRPPAPRRYVLFDYSDDDDLDRSQAENGDGSHGQDDEADGEEVDEDYVGVVRRSERETEYNPLEHVYHDSEEEEDTQDSDDEPIRFVRRGGGGEDQPAEDDSDDDRPILSRLRSRTVVRPGPTAPAPAVAPAMAPPAPAPPERPPSSCSDSASSVIEDATVAKINGADCGICYLPLKPPIFQCGIGHVVCSRCSARMGKATTCHKCRAPMPDGYSRCHDMEQLVDSIRVPCPHAAHGCAARPVYHGRDAHARACPHAPCHCPAEACGFGGSTAALADHLAAGAHGWPCATTDGLVVDDGGSFSIPFRDGFSFVAGGAAANSGGDRFLLLLNVERAPPLGRAVTAFCVHHDRAATARLKIASRRRYMSSTHSQESELEVACTDLSDGMPGPSRDCFRFVVPGSGREDDAITILSITPPLI